MRIERPGDRRYAWTLAALLVVATTGLGGALSGWAGAVLGGLAGLAAGRLLERRMLRRSRRRREVVSLPFPEPWRRVLERRCDHYDRLPAQLKAGFERDVQLFVAEHRITGVGLRVDDELRLLVASSAISLSLGWPDYEWDHLAEVLLYPRDFGRDYSLGTSDLAGQAHPWGTIILSVPALQLSFDDPDDAFHVGLHEFAHLLDVDHTHFDGVPVGLDGAHQPRWLALMEEEMARLRRRDSVLDPYGEDDPVEFLAVAVEAFFEIPLAVRESHRELYSQLAGYFGQDPASWDERRELVYE